MAGQATERKSRNETEIGAEEARKGLTGLLGRSAFAEERFVITKNGKPQAALIGIPDLERLRALDASEANEPARR